MMLGFRHTLTGSRSLKAYALAVGSIMFTARSLTSRKGDLDFQNFVQWFTPESLSPDRDSSYMFCRPQPFNLPHNKGASSSFIVGR